MAEPSDLDLDNWDAVYAPVTPGKRLRAYVAPLALPPVDFDWNAPKIIPELPPMPKGWKAPEFDKHGMQKCTRWYPCHGKYCERCERVKTHRRARKLAYRIIGKRCALITLTRP